MPGYPTRKLLFGGPETRTKADMVSHGDELVGAGLRRQQALHGRPLDFPSTVALLVCAQGAPAWCAVGCGAVRCGAAKPPGCRLVWG
jgi:hypothetical protein